MANKVRTGLKNVHVASVTVSGGSVTFGTPKEWPGAVSMSYAPTGELTEFYADDIVYWTGGGSSGYDCSLETALIPDWFYTDYLGMVVDDNGNLLETSNDNGANFAFLFEFTGDENAIRHAFYYCKASKPTEEGETKGETEEPKTTTVEFKASPCPVTVTIDGVAKNPIKVKSTPNTSNYATWYSTLSLPTVSGS